MICKKCNDTGILEIPENENESVKICTCQEGKNFSESLVNIFDQIGIKIELKLISNTKTDEKLAN